MNRNYIIKYYFSKDIKISASHIGMMISKVCSNLPQFNGDIRLLGEFLEEHKIAIEALDKDSAGAAANGWMKYLKKRSKVKCPECGHKLNLKEHFLSDFYIGGFAITRCDSILTRDRGIYKKYFPGLPGYEGCLK